MPRQKTVAIGGYKKELIEKLEQFRPELKGAGFSTRVQTLLQERLAEIVKNEPEGI